VFWYSNVQPTARVAKIRLESSVSSLFWALLFKVEASTLRCNSAFTFFCIFSLSTEIYNKTKGLFDTKTLLGTGLLIYGLKKFKTDMILPGGATLIWWSYRLLSKKS